MRAERGVCHSLQLPLEVCERFFQFSLTTPDSKMYLFKDENDGRRRICGTSLETNRTREICHELRRADMRFLELSMNCLIVVEIELLAELLAAPHSAVKRHLEKVSLCLVEGRFPNAALLKTALHSVLAFAVANPRVDIEIRLYALSFDERQAKFMREFLLHGIGIQQAMRNVKTISFWCIRKIRQWRGNTRVSSLDSNNAKFRPKEAIVNERLFREKIALARKADRDFKQCLKWFHHSDEEAAVERIVEEVGRWYQVGI